MSTNSVIVTAMAWVALGLLVGHFFLDLRLAYREIKHPKDLAWTVVTIVVLAGHLASDALL